MSAPVLIWQGKFSEIPWSNEEGETPQHVLDLEFRASVSNSTILVEELRSDLFGAPSWRLAGEGALTDDVRKHAMGLLMDCWEDAGLEPRALQMHKALLHTDDVLENRTSARHHEGDEGAAACDVECDACAFEGLQAHVEETLEGFAGGAQVSPPKKAPGFTLDLQASAVDIARRFVAMCRKGFEVVTDEEIGRLEVDADAILAEASMSKVPVGP